MTTTSTAGFAGAVLQAATESGLTSGLFLGCGLGSTYATLARAGLDLVGLDPSPTALARLGNRIPEHRDRLVCGGLESLPDGVRYGLVIGVQMLSHGPRAAVVERLREAQRRLSPGGLFCLRVSAADSGIWPAHDVTGRHADGGLSVRYRTACTAGSEAHFFSASELEALFAGKFSQVLAPRQSRVAARPPMARSSTHWEGIWRRTG